MIVIVIVIVIIIVIVMCVYIYIYIYIYIVLRHPAADAPLAAALRTGTGRTGPCHPRAVGRPGDRYYTILYYTIIYYAMLCYTIIYVLFCIYRRRAFFRGQLPRERLPESTRVRLLSRVFIEGLLTCTTLRYVS